MLQFQSAEKQQKLGIVYSCGFTNLKTNKSRKQKTEE